MQKEIKIPNKSLFKLDEVCSLTGVKPYVLRFWESEFQQISPVISGTGQKLYEHKDIEAVVMIKELLFERKLTIENAKFELDKIYNTQEVSQETKAVEQVENTRPAQVSMELKSKDLKNLDVAKELLRAVVESTKSIQERNNWI
jgi:DNA-binding transcriptional MerR regulator